MKIFSIMLSPVGKNDFVVKCLSFKKEDDYLELKLLDGRAEVIILRNYYWYNIREIDE